MINIAHRGASALAPEHTFPAWDLALKQGADYLEQDLRLTKDGVLVAIHDATIDRTGRGSSPECSGPVAEKTLRELKTCDVGSWFNQQRPELARSSFEGLSIATLDDIFDRYGRHTNYYIELKDPPLNPGIERVLLTVMRTYDLLRPAARARRVFIQSFSSTSLRWIHAADPLLPLVQLLPGTSPGVVTRALSAIATYAVGIGAPAADIDDEVIETAHALGLQVHPYTVDDPATMTDLIEMGVDGIFTNLPSVLVQELKVHRSFTAA